MSKTKKKRKRNKGVDVNVRKKLYDVQRGYCFYCLEFVPWQYATGDHYLPVSKGGSKNITNIVMACKQCNTNKGATVYNEAYLQSRISFFNR